MARYNRPPFQLDRPLFCKVPQTAFGKNYKAGDLFKWKDLQVDPDKILVMYNNGQFYHSDELEETLEPPVGDGLDELNIVALHKIVDNINTKVRALNDDKVRFCKKSNLKNRQVGLIRNWRINFSQHE